MRRRWQDSLYPLYPPSCYPSSGWYNPFPVVAATSCALPVPVPLSCGGPAVYQPTTTVCTSGGCATLPSGPPNLLPVSDSLCFKRLG